MASNQLKITHLPTGAEFKFKRRGLTLFTESYSSSWNPEKVFGKMDPILSYSNTERKLSFSITVTGTGDKKQAEALARALYPTYSNNNALSLKEPPLLRILFGDLIKAGENKGLLCAVETLTVDRGDKYFLTGRADRASDKPGYEAGRIVLQFEVTPLHEYDLGWFEVTDKDARNEIIQVNTKLDDKKRVKFKPQIDERTKVYQFGSSTPQVVTFSNRPVNQVFTKAHPLGILAVKEKK
jgi:hypothetical protein